MAWLGDRRNGALIHPENDHALVSCERRTDRRGMAGDHGGGGETVRPSPENPLRPQRS